MIAIAESDLSLVEKYRPRTLADVHGQDGAMKLLVPYSKRPVSKAFIFHGPSGTGKTSAALALGRDLGVNVDDSEFGGFYEIKAGEQTIDSLRALLRRIPVAHGFGRSGSGHKLVLIEEAERCSKDAAVWWQSAVEEIRRNVPRCTIVFTTNYPEKMHPTLRSRFSLVAFTGDRDALASTAERIIADLWTRETGRTDPPPPLSDFPEWSANDSGELNIRGLVEQFEDYLIVNEISRAWPALELVAPKQPEPTLFGYVGRFATQEFPTTPEIIVESIPTVDVVQCATPEQPTKPVGDTTKQARIRELSVDHPDYSDRKLASLYVSTYGGTCSKETVAIYRAAPRTKPVDATPEQPVTLATLPSVTLSPEPCCDEHELEPCAGCVTAKVSEPVIRRPKLSLTIGDTDYSVSVLLNVGRIILDKPDGSAYAVSRIFAKGVEQCDCPDFQHRHKDAGTDCKHIASLRSVGMLSER